MEPLGALEAADEAFAVEEIPAYAPCGAGEHLYVEIRKRGRTTDQVAAALARLCGRPLGAVGFAGRKDRHAIAQQWFSVQGVEEERAAELAERLKDERCELLQSARHRNKLRLGHLRGNRFRLRLRGLESAEAQGELAGRLRALAHGGVENGFGEQRFGVAGSTLRIARAWASGDPAEAVRHLVDPLGEWRLGQPLPAAHSSGPQGRARRALSERPDDAVRALRAAGRSFRLLVASSAQSAIFNAVLEARRAELGLHALRVGDLAQGPGGAPFRCRPERMELLLEQAAPGRLEVAATGPLPGRSTFEPDPPIAAQERAWAAPLQIDWAGFGSRAALESAGARRALLVGFLEPPALGPTPHGVELCFALPKGSYATEVLRQLGVEGRVPAAFAAAEAAGAEAGPEPAAGDPPLRGGRA